MRLRLLCPGLLLLGIALMVPFQTAITLVLGIACLIAFVVTGVFLVATPEYLQQNDDDV